MGFNKSEVRELGNWRRLSCQDETPEEVAQRTLAMATARRKARARPGVKPRPIARGCELLYTEGGNRRGAAEAAPRTRLRPILYMRLALQRWMASNDKQWWELPRGRLDLHADFYDLVILHADFYEQVVPKR